MVVIDEAFSTDEQKNKKQLRGIKDINLFKSALNQPKQTFDKKDLYPDVITKAACYLRSFAMDHAFHDGNKRTALMTAIIFLERNGYEVKPDNDKLSKFVEKIVNEKLGIPWITKNLKKYVKEMPRRKRILGVAEFIENVRYKIKKKTRRTD